MLLTIKTRQKYLKELGFYSGSVDGSVGPLTKKAYKDLQNKYFTRNKDKDGYYGPNTDILLRSAYNCRGLKYFKLTEFKCGCKGSYCTGYPKTLNRDLVLNLDNLRGKYGKSITVTSGLRCSKYNSKVGGSTNSRHKTGKASDVYMSGKSNTFSGRKELVNYWINNYLTARYSYCNGYGRTKTRTSYPKSSTMGNATHFDVK